MRSMFGSFGLGACLAMATVATVSVGPAITAAAEPSRAAAKRKAVRLGYATSSKPPRSRNAPTKRKLKGNRLHVSRRTKRRHRRAA
jgi:hypothetical protein